MRDWQTVLLSALGVVVVGCGSTASGAGPTPTVPAQKAPQYQMVVASSQVALGRQRFTFGVLRDNHPVETNSLKTTFFTINGNKATPAETTLATFNHFAKGLKDNSTNSAAVEIGGVYVAYPTFTKTGTWGLQTEVPSQGKSLQLRTSFVVQPRLTIPAVGQPAPRSNNPTTAQMPATKLDSGRPPDDMHAISIARAISQHKPLVVLFATAAFCQSRLCGPEIETVQSIERTYHSKVNFVHIEVYKNAVFKDGFAPTFLQWHLQTEPWVFVVNRRGRIAAEFEGATPASEIVPALQQVLKS